MGDMKSKGEVEEKKLFDVGQPKLVIPPEEDEPAKPIDIGQFSPPLPFEPLAGAEFSDDRVYRYLLWRRLFDKGPTILYVGTNPSTADETNDDPTMVREINFAKAWGYALLLKVNIFSFKATDPKELKWCEDPVGKLTDQYLMMYALRADTIVFCCGNAGYLRGRFKIVNEMFMQSEVIRPKLHAMGWTKKGFPRHTLYLPSKTKPIPYGIVEKELEL